MDLSSEPTDKAFGFCLYTQPTSSMADSMKALGHHNENASPELGADMAEIRARVLGRRMEAAQAVEAARDKDALTTEEHREVYRELQRKHQVNLNEELHAAALEDPTLVAHMEASRRRLAEQEQALLRLPRLETLRTRYLKAMGQISSLVRGLEEQHMAERENAEIGHRQRRVLIDLSEGRKPHGFPAFGSAARGDPGAKEALALAAIEAEKVAQSYDGLLHLIADSKQALFVLRREVETVGDGLIELVEAAEEDRRRLREFFLIASRFQAAGPPRKRISADPASSE